VKSRVGVVGAGLVGASAAAHLGRLGFDVVVFDRQVPIRQTGKLGIDLRNVALTQGSQDLLAQLGVWQALDIPAYHRMIVWEEWGASELCFDAADIGATQMGWIAENSLLTTALWNLLEQMPQVEVCVGSIEALSIDDSGVVVTLDGEHTKCELDFIIGADGARSLVAEQLQVSRRDAPTGQVALATVVRHADSHQHTAWQRFLVDGPCALLPGHEVNLSSIVWSQSPAQAERRGALTDAQFCAELTAVLEDRLGQILEVDQRLTFPLTQQQAGTCHPHPRALLVGDALRVVHPLAGLGVNLGLEDVAQLCAVARLHDDLSAPDIWRRFARRRETRSAFMIKLLASLQGIYGESGPSMSLLRNLGVRMVNAQQGLKRQIMRETFSVGS